MNDNISLSFRDFKCSECGKEFTVSSLTFYKYKVPYSQKTEYQCSYTCYDHALLRKETPDDYFEEGRYRELVTRCETSMKGQGKDILHPIKL